MWLGFESSPQMLPDLAIFCYLGNFLMHAAIFFVQIVGQLFKHILHYNFAIF